MSQKIKNTPAAKAVSRAKLPKMLVPRTAPSAMPTSDAEIPTGTVSVAPEAASVAAIAPKLSANVPTAKAAPAKRARKVSQVEETVAKHQKELADALVMAQAINYDQPKVAKAVAAKPAKARKVKLVRDSYAMPEREYAQIGALKKRLAALGNDVKKSELLRGGIVALVALDDAALKEMMARVERIKTGRPAK